MKNIDSFFSLMNYFDTVMVTDRKGRVKYYINQRSDLYSSPSTKVIGMHLLELHPELTEGTSSIMTVLKTGEPIYDRQEKMVSRTGKTVKKVFSTLPIVREGELVGAIDLSRYIDVESEKVFSADGTEFRTKIGNVDDIRGESPQVQKLRDIVRTVAGSDSSILLYGETGTGKGLVAEALHTSSPRVEKPFISQNCAAIPTDLLEGMLFGTMRGSFTGAETRPGLLEMADGGTLLLDELNSMDITMQSKLLKVIEEKRLRRVGGTKDIPIDVRFITAINKDPVECLREGTIRQDLFYRLNVVNITIPPLREREGDIQELCTYFIGKYNNSMNKKVVGIDDYVDRIFRTYNWPGNVRELENIIEGAFNVIPGGLITKAVMPAYLLRKYEEPQSEMSYLMNPELSLKENVEYMEKNMILNVIKNAKSISQAARVLKISKQDLSYKLKKYDIKL